MRALGMACIVPERELTPTRARGRREREEASVAEHRRSRSRKRYNPYVATLGFILMLLGAVIILIMFVMEVDLDKHFNSAVIGVAMTVVGWILQILYGRRRH